MQRSFIAVSVAVLLVTAAVASAQDVKTGTQATGQQIRGLLNELEVSFTRRDAKTLAGCWARGGTFAGSSERVEGRENIEKAFGDFFATHKGGALKLRITSLRIASDDLVFVETIADVTPKTTDAANEESVLSLVLARRDGRWMIENARETAMAAVSPAEHLKALEWMVGEWSDQISSQNGLSVKSVCDWTANRTFLIRKFKVEGANLSRTGTEVIGWDPRGQKIRSWVFDSDGGFGENVWVRDGNRWLVRHAGTRADGSEVSATNVLTVIDANTVTVQSKDRMVGGERQPDVAEVTLIRRPVAKGQANPSESPKPSPQVLPSTNK